MINVIQLNLNYILDISFLNIIKMISVFILKHPLKVGHSCFEYLVNVVSYKGTESTPSTLKQKGLTTYKVLTF